MIQNQIYNPDDTICAISTPYGMGGIAVVRVSGRDAFDIVDTIWKGKKLATAPSHTVHLGHIIDPDENGSVIDQAVATVYRGPNSFTGEDVVELGIHGSLWIQRQLIELLVKQGCRTALGGEFSRRAFAAGKMDLAQTEAVADLIASSSRAAHRLAMSQMRGSFSKMLEQMRSQLVDLASLLELELDFSEEDVEFASRQKLRLLAQDIQGKLSRLADSYSAGQAIKNGIPVAIIGKTNAGKSSLLNALLGDERAIVSDIHGTTRDVIEDTMELGPFLVRFKDTAGLRHTDDPIETLGIERSRTEAAKAEIVLYVVDATETLDIPFMIAENADTDPQHLIFAINKTDLCTTEHIEEQIKTIWPNAITALIQAKNHKGIEQLKQLITGKLQNLNDAAAQGEVMVTNVRHAAYLQQAAQSLQTVIEGIDNQLSGDFIAQDLRQAIHQLSSITGSITTPDLLQNIFSKFCIGK